MDEVKTRRAALNASKKKWTTILEQIAKIQEDVGTMCGFCGLAQYNAQGGHFSKCTICEPDAKKLCEDYITDACFITDPLMEAWNRTEELLIKIKALPVTRAPSKKEK